MRRSLRFDAIVDGALSVLEEPRVEDAFNASLLEPGVLRAIKQAINQAYLPNIRHGRVTIPRRYRKETDRTPIIPLNNDEARRGVDLDAEMFTMTDSRLADITRAMHQRGESYREKTAQALSSMAIEQVQQNSNFTHVILTTTGSCKAEGTAIDGLFCRPRPNIFINAEQLEKIGKGRIQRIDAAAVLGHEMLHAVDFEALTCDDPLNHEGDRPKLSTFLESRGYHFSARLLNATGAIDRSPKTQKVDDARAQHNPSDPFATPQSLIDEFMNLDVLSKERAAA